MPSDQPGEPANLDPDQIASHTFERSRRGFDEDEVRAYLNSLASQLRVTQQRQADAERRIAQIDRRAANLEELDLSQLTTLLGEETVRVLETARTSAEEIRSKAEESAGRLVADASEQASATRTAADEYAEQVRTAADTETTKQRADADEYATTVRREADEASRTTRADADAYALEVRSAADADVQAMRAEAEADADRLRGEAETVLDERTAVAEAEASTIREGAEEVLRHATDHAAALRSEAEEETTALRAEVATEVADLRASAQIESAELLSGARTEADRLREEAEAEATATREAAETTALEIRAEAREDGRAMVEEARAYREKVIADLADRRRTARLALDELFERRQALLDALSQVTVRVASAEADLATALPDPGDVGDLSTDRVALGAVDHAGADPSSPGDAEATGIGVGEISSPPPPPPPPPPPSIAASETAGADEAPATNGTNGTGVADAVVESTDSADETSVEVDDATEPAAEPLSAESEPSEVGGDEPPRGIDAIFADLKADSSRPEVAQVHVDDATSVASVALAVDEAGIPANVAASADGEPEVDDDADEVDPASDEGILARRDDVIDAPSRRLARQLKRELSTEENEVLDRLRRTKGEPDAEEALPGPDEHVDRYRSLVAAELSTAASAGVTFFPGSASAARNVEVDDLAGELAASVVEQLRARLDRAFTDGGDEAEVADRIRASYREWKTERIAGAAEDSVLAAFGRGVFEGAPASTAFRWVVDDGEHPCPDCDDDALAGAVPKGEGFPTGAIMPPAHPGCRCLIVPADAAAP